MANVSRPFGLKPVRYMGGAPYSGAIESFHVPAGYGPNMFLGDPVILTGTGNTTTFLGFPPGMLADVALTAIPPVGLAALTYSQYLIGSIVGILPVTRETAIYRPALTEAVIECTIDPNIIYEIQDNGGAAAGGIGFIGANCNLYAGAGSAFTGQSGYMLDFGLTTSPGLSLNQQMTVYRGASRGTNDPTSPFAVWEALINWHPFDAPALGI